MTCPRWTVDGRATWWKSYGTCNSWRGFYSGRDEIEARPFWERKRYGGDVDSYSLPRRLAAGENGLGCLKSKQTTEVLAVFGLEFTWANTIGPDTPLI